MAGASIRLRLKRVNVNRAELMGPSGPLYAAVERAGVAAVAAVQEATPVRSGRLKDSWEYRIRKTPERLYADVFVSTTAPGVGTPPSQYVKFVVFGTNGPIRSTTPGRKMKILTQGGGRIFRDEVAGQQANPFPIQALKKIRKASFEE